MPNDYLLGTSKLFHDNKQLNIASEVRKKLSILNEGIYKILWYYDGENKQVYVKISTPQPSDYDASEWPKKQTRKKPVKG